MSSVILKSRVVKNKISSDIASLFDYSPDEKIITEIKIPEIPTTFSLGVIVGGSGSGKSTILKRLGVPKVNFWDSSKNIASHFKNTEDCINKLNAAGLRSLPTWLRPYHTLSNGEKFRADVARQIESGAIIDEFTSVVDRNVAKSCSVSLAKYIRKEHLRGVVLASCHFDILEWLLPDWVYNADIGEFADRRVLRRPSIDIKLRPSTPEAWPLFSRHHYLSGALNRSSRCWIATWDSIIVGFVATLAYPSGTVKNAWREHRTVVLPEFQGMGIGSAISDRVARNFVSTGHRYFSKTAHPCFGNHRENSEHWRPTSKNKKARPDYLRRGNTKKDGKVLNHVTRCCFSHEYMLHSVKT